MRNKQLVGSYLTFLLMFPIGLRADGGHAHGPDGSHISDAFQSASLGDVIKLSREAEENLDIQTTTIHRELLAPVKTLYGRVTADPREESLITAPFRGKVLNMFALSGAKVEKDQELLRVQPIELGGQIKVLRSPINGFVTDIRARPGQIFEPTDPLLVVSNLDHVLFEGDLFDSTITESIQHGGLCTVHTKRYPKKHFSCRIETVDAIFRGNPPVGHVHARIENSETALKPGMTGQIHLGIGDRREKLVVPKQAVLGKFERQFVFRKHDHTYIKTYIKLGDSYGDSVEVRDGLAPDDVVVVQGHYQLQFAKSEASNDHHHNEESNTREHSHIEADSHDHERHSHSEERTQLPPQDHHDHSAKNSEEAHDHHQHDDHIEAKSHTHDEPKTTKSESHSHSEDNHHHH
ncbi:MAG: efflux RND transporter periplasmic adaptor subunit [Bdellovibrionales bacterium]|nr:efflux RND transporter periplasmic adaptor subunit [Bdellovibrionales bacterium]